MRWQGMCIKRKQTGWTRKHFERKQFSSVRSTAHSTFVVQFVDYTFNVKIVHCIYIRASVHCRNLCWGKLYWYVCICTLQRPMLSVQGELQGFWPVPVRPAAAPLQSQTGFGHHHSNSATALTFIKYLLMFMFMLSSTIQINEPLVCLQFNSMCILRHPSWEINSASTRWQSKSMCDSDTNMKYNTSLGNTNAQYMISHLECCIFMYLSHCTWADLWMLIIYEFQPRIVWVV